MRSSGGRERRVGCGFGGGTVVECEGVRWDVRGFEILEAVRGWWIDCVAV